MTESGGSLGIHTLRSRQEYRLEPDERQTSVAFAMVCRVGLPAVRRKRATDNRKGGTGSVHAANTIQCLAADNRELGRTTADYWGLVP
jgi:hypothetical protein